MIVVLVLVAVWLFCPFILLPVLMLCWTVRRSKAVEAAAYEFLAAYDHHPNNPKSIADEFAAADKLREVLDA